MFQIWEPTKIRTDVYSVAVRRLLLRPFCPKNDNETLEGLGKSVRRVSACRFDMLVGLKKLGWGSLNPSSNQETNFTYVANCPPYCAGLRPEEDVLFRSCRHHDVCPWCWGRNRIRRVFGCLQSGAALLGINHSSEPPKVARLRLMALRSTRSFGSAKQAAEYIDTWLTAIGCVLKTDRYRGYVMLGSLYPSFNNSGKFVAHTSAWAFPDEKFEAQYGIAELFKALIGPVECSGYSFADFNNIRKATLQPLIFHRTMLTGDPRSVLTCLETIRDRVRFRMLRAGGVCMSDSSTDLPQEE